MRLICPNCGAQYEVDASVIPEQGRDVQCSNCGHTWFQTREQKEVAPADLTGTATATASPPEPSSSDTETVAPPPTYEETATEAEDDPPAETAADVLQQSLDPEIAKLLREEAEREAAARADESIETQTEMGLEDGADGNAAARARLARMRGGDESGFDGDEGKPPPGSRKELLPDVEEINSSLRPSSEREADEAELAIEPAVEVEETGRRGGAGRWLFRLIVLAAIVAVAAYVFAPQIVEFVPEAEPYLAGYVDQVNGLRAQIDPLVGGLAEQVRGLISGGEGETPAE